MSNEECLQHAVTFVRKYGYNAKNAAKEWGLHENMVNRAVRILNTKEKLESIGVKIPHSASEEIVNRLHPVIIYGDEVLKNAAEAVFKSGVGSREVEKLAQDIKAARNEQSKLEVINKFTNSERVKRSQAETKGGRIKQPRPLPRTMLARHLDAIEKLFKNYPAKEALRAPGEEGKEVRACARQVVGYLMTLFNIGTAPKEEVG